MKFLNARIVSLTLASWRSNRFKLSPVTLSLAITLLLSSAGYAQQDSVMKTNRLKNMSIEELMDIEVTLVSRKAEKLAEAPSAIQVVTGEDILRSGATNIPEALRLFSNLQVAQLNANAWIISARGFNNVFANKLLVMIDGRTVYTPLFGGVLWEMQHVLIEDVDRIEVISGPGSTMWGANAVNGVINITTKHTSNTQGLYAGLLGGTFVREMAMLRYGGKISDGLTYKVYGQHLLRNQMKSADGTENDDRWRANQGGFRVDWNKTPKDALLLQGDLYAGTKNNSTGNSDFNGQQLMAKWTHQRSQASGYALHFYYDRYLREDTRGKGVDELRTYDVDFQHHLQAAPRQQLIWGVGYRIVKDEYTNQTQAAGILPTEKNLNMLNVFVQDQISLSKALKLSIGSKLLHNVYTGWELQPGARLAYTPTSNSLFWSAISRAVRTPSRFDVDYFIPIAPIVPGNPRVAGGPDFQAEKMIAYELGYRLQPSQHASISLATFFNDYDDVYSVEALPGTLTYQIMNGSTGQSWGAELSGNWRITKNWKIRGGYTYLKVDLKSKPGRIFDPSYLSNDARNQAVLQSSHDIGTKIQFNWSMRYVDRLSATLSTAKVPAYCTVDARLAFQLKKLQVSVVGQNLLQDKHAEFDLLQVPRGCYLQLTGKF